VSSRIFGSVSVQRFRFVSYRDAEILPVRAIIVTMAYATERYDKEYWQAAAFNRLVSFIINRSSMINKKDKMSVFGIVS
jgi:hypothetical protein